MKIQTASLLLAITVLPYATAQACDVPVAPPTPDGGSATLEDMIAAQGEVKTFQAANAEYLECVDDLMTCLLYTSPSPRDYAASRMPSSA